MTIATQEKYTLPMASQMAKAPYPFSDQAEQCYWNQQQHQGGPCNLLPERLII